MRVEVVTVGPGPARWEERNRALEETEADVLAFVDHDVAVPAGWAERIERAWGDAGPEVAALGGPVAAQRPGWAPASLEVALGGVDHGTERRALDPAAETLVGGNLSFRVWQLAAIGGFKPPPDESGDRDWFAEEHEAQRELARWGWSVVYDPELRLVRTAAPTRRELLRARYRYGARQGRAGSRPRGAAARQVVSSAAGLLPAAARRDRGRTSERLARLAENLGTAAARRPRAGTGAAAARRRPARAAAAPHVRGGTILLYHRVAERSPDPLGLCVSPAHFAEQLAVLGDRVVTVEEVVATGAGIAITFDDGYADNLESALPLLEAAGAPATVFAATGHIASGRGFFWDELTRLLLTAAPPGGLELDIGGERRAWDDMAQARYDLHHLLQPRAPELIEDVIEQLRGWAGAAADGDEDRPLTVDELRRLAGGVEIGAHTRRHVSLRFQPADVQREEIEGSRDDVEEWTGRSPRGFSYPFGVPGRDFVRRTRALVAEAGFDYAVGNHPGSVTETSDRFGLPRLAVPDVGGAEFARWLAQ